MMNRIYKPEHQEFIDKSQERISDITKSLANSLFYKGFNAREIDAAIKNSTVINGLKKNLTDYIATIPYVVYEGEPLEGGEHE